MVSSNRIAASKGEALSIWREINQRLVTLLIRASAGNDQSAGSLLLRGVSAIVGSTITVSLPEHTGVLLSRYPATSGPFSCGDEGHSVVLPATVDRRTLSGIP